MSRHTANMAWCVLIAIVTWLLFSPGREADAAGQCLFSEGTDWQLACTANQCVICQDGECKRFVPSDCRRVE